MKRIEDLVKEYIDTRTNINKLEGVKGNLSRDIKAYLMAKGLKELEVDGVNVTYEAPTVRAKIEYDQILLDHGIKLEDVRDKYTTYIHVKDSIDVRC